MKALALLVPLLLYAVPAWSRPNILLIITDDQGYGDVSIHGNEWIETPNMDRIATEGARFERFFVEPVCAPTRAALLSGRYPTRVGVTGVMRNREAMRGEEVTIAELLRQAGYATGAFGKWHNGAHWPCHPNAQGFEEFAGFCGGHWNDYFDPVLERNGEFFQARGYIADILTDHALDFIDRKKDGPFFCYVPFNTPHTPASAPVEAWEKWWKRQEPEDEFTRLMYAMCENIDDNIGRLLSKLEKLDIADDTIVLFMTDNGPNGDRFNGNMLGRKGSVHEGGVRVPLFIRWPAQIEAGTVVQPNVAHVDLLPTLCRFAGIDDPETLPPDGLDISPLLLGDRNFEMPQRNLFVWRNPGKWSIRSPRYRATARTLHDLHADPGQTINLAEQKPELHRQLVHAYEKWEAVAVPAHPEPLPVHLGHQEWPRVTIKAHEFEIHPGAGEGIDYCEMRGYANQWIERWTDVEAYADCPVKVVEGGRYRVRFRYACPPDSVGSILKLTAGESELEFGIKEPWISAPFPAPEQVKAGNRYLSREAWKDMDAGEIKLEKGDFMLRLSAVEKSGERMPDFKAVILEKVES